MQDRFYDTNANYVDWQDNLQHYAEGIELILTRNDINAEFVNATLSRKNSKYPIGIISFEITGDWKHEHAYADELVTDKYGTRRVFKIEEIDEEDTGDDWYTSTHVYYVLL